MSWTGFDGICTFIMLVEYCIHLLMFYCSSYFCNFLDTGFDFFFAPCLNDFAFFIPDGEAEGAEFYTLVAQKLDYLVKHQQRISPTAAKNSVSPKDPNITIPTDRISGNSGIAFFFLCV